MIMKDKLKVIYTLQEMQRLDKFLAELKIQELYSRTFIEHLIEEERVLVNLTPVKKSYLLKEGDEVIINLPEPEPMNVLPQDIPLDVVYEDEHLAIINKKSRNDCASRFWKSRRNFGECHSLSLWRKPFQRKRI